MGTTFSQLVDKMVQETLRPELRVQVASYLNQAIREVHFDPQTNGAMKFKDNFTELSLTAGVESGFTWEIANPDRFQAMQVVQYPNVYVDDKESFPEELVPSRGMVGKTRFYYRASGVYVFKGYGGVNGIVNLGFYEYPRALKYYPVDQRVATYDDVMGWTYADTVVTPGDEALARQMTSNWLLIRWDTVLEEALRAKVYKRLEQTERARTSYSLYTALRRGLVTSESDSEAQFS